MIFVWLLLLVPVSLVAEHVLHLPPLWVFVTAVLAIIPLAEWIRRATEQLAELSGPAVGGLVNVTFGNMAELILALFVLSAVVLILMYVGHLIYTLITHRSVFSREHEKGRATWSLFTALAVHVGATAVTALQAELVSGALEATAATLGLTPFFLGITVLAVIGNAAEYISAVYFARHDRMGLVLGITVGTSIQIALLVAPLLVIVSYLMGTPMNLVFSNPLELIAIAGAAFIVNAIASDGESTWFEGLLLLAVYAILGLAFFYASP